MEQEILKNNTQDIADNTYIDATLRGFRRATIDDFKEGKIDKKEYDDLMAILDRPE